MIRVLAGPSAGIGSDGTLRPLDVRSHGSTQGNIAAGIPWKKEAEGPLLDVLYRCIFSHLGPNEKPPDRNTVMLRHITSICLIG